MPSIDPPEWDFDGGRFLSDVSTRAATPATPEAVLTSLKHNRLRPLSQSAGSLPIGRDDRNKRRFRRASQRQDSPYGVRNKAQGSPDRTYLLGDLSEEVRFQNFVKDEAFAGLQRSSAKPKAKVKAAFQQAARRASLQALQQKQAGTPDPGSASRGSIAEFCQEEFDNVVRRFAEDSNSIARTIDDLKLNMGGSVDDARKRRANADKEEQERVRRQKDRERRAARERAKQTRNVRERIKVLVAESREREESGDSAIVGDMPTVPYLGCNLVNIHRIQSGCMALNGAGGIPSVETIVECMGRRTIQSSMSRSHSAALRDFRRENRSPEQLRLFTPDMKQRTAEHRASSRQRHAREVQDRARECFQDESFRKLANAKSAPDYELRMGESQGKTRDELRRDWAVIFRAVSVFCAMADCCEDQISVSRSKTREDLGATEIGHEARALVKKRWGDVWRLLKVWRWLHRVRARSRSIELVRSFMESLNEAARVKLASKKCISRVRKLKLEIREYVQRKKKRVEKLSKEWAKLEEDHLQSYYSKKAKQLTEETRAQKAEEALKQGTVIPKRQERIIGVTVADRNFCKKFCAPADWRLKVLSKVYNQRVRNYIREFEVWREACTMCHQEQAQMKKFLRMLHGGNEEEAREAERRADPDDFSLPEPPSREYWTIATQDMLELIKDTALKRKKADPGQFKDNGDSKGSEDLDAAEAIQHGIESRQREEKQAELLSLPAPNTMEGLIYQFTQQQKLQQEDDSVDEENLLPFHAEF
eukprot:CAMPEP_0204317448 /NCGR_PEP_ID=MMETSP0469-20131031/5974_1 /ASSEMBLY_ACC=CAM_ASM_000384 /TAXON_ID=2969 /ORGANISM="Oxyrrhis marina" /LENGTH=763 /DNA_ID=CAMNT_0051298373 /DNA_START=47 /DNA_END=2338 /DNA_ORIENTATION=-